MSNSSTSVPNELHGPLVNLLLSVADEKFFLGHRNSDWTGLGPFLEEDIAFSNIAQDEIAHAQELYKLAAAFTAPSDDTLTEANRLAYARPAAERFGARLVELVDDYNWAVAIAQVLYHLATNVGWGPTIGRPMCLPLPFDGRAGAESS